MAPDRLQLALPGDPPWVAALLVMAAAESRAATLPVPAEPAPARPAVTPRRAGPCSRSPHNNMNWGRRLAEPLLQGVLHLDDGESSRPVQRAARLHQDVDQELASLRLEVRELWRRLRAIEDGQRSHGARLEWVEAVAGHAQRRWRIIR